MDAVVFDSQDFCQMKIFRNMVDIPIVYPIFLGLQKSFQIKIIKLPFIDNVNICKFHLINRPDFYTSEQPE